jgi:hypothetical protein
MLDRLVTEACVTVELLPLDPLDLFVVFVNEVRVDIVDGEVRCALAVARTILCPWTGSSSSESDDDEDDALRF